LKGKKLESKVGGVQNLKLPSSMTGLKVFRIIDQPVDTYNMDERT